MRSVREWICAAILVMLLFAAGGAPAVGRAQEKPCSGVGRLLEGVAGALLMVAGSAGEEADQADDKSSESDVPESEQPAQAADSGDSTPPPPDASVTFAVSRLEISGNDLIPTEQLLEQLPETYAVGEATYDFRVLHEVISDPGPQRNVSKGTITGLTQYLLAFYQDRGYAGIYVYVPLKAIKGVAQLEDGVLPIQILEGKVAEVEVNRYDFDRRETETEVLGSSLLRYWSPIKPGTVIKKKQLDDFVRLLNLNPDRHISAIFTRSSDPNALNLTYDVYEANPWHWYAQVDDSGTDTRQWAPRVGLVNTNLTGRDDRLFLMYQTRVDAIENNGVEFGSYEFPVFTPRLRVGVYAGYSNFEITPETGAGISFRGDGSLYGTTVRYNMFQVSDWLFDVLGTVSHERSRVSPSLGLSTDVNMDLFGVGAEISRSGEMSETSFSFMRTENFNGSDREEFERARVDAQPDFTILTLMAGHRQFVDDARIHELSGSVRSTQSDGRLIPAKMSAFGGLYTVRGYDEDEYVADGGVILSAQYRFDLTRYLHRDDQLDDEQGDSDAPEVQDNGPPKVSLLAFTDYAKGKTIDPIPGEISRQIMWGAGVGTSIEFNNNLSAAVYCSWPLKDTVGTDSGSETWNFSFMFRN